MGRILDEFLKRHNFSDTAVLSLIGMGCLALSLDDGTPDAVKARVEKIEQDAHKVVENAVSIRFSMRGGFTDFDSADKDRQ